MKTIALGLIVLLIMLSAAAAQTPVSNPVAPIALKAPEMTLSKDTCVFITYCGKGQDVHDIANEMHDSLYKGSRFDFRIGERDVGNLFNYNFLFNAPPKSATDFNSDHAIGGAAINDANVSYCWTKGGNPAVFDEQNTPVDTILIELWSPECGEMPKICTEYNGKNIKLLEEGSNYKYLFLNPQGAAFFKGAGFYASCGKEKPPFIDPGNSRQISAKENREKVLIAGNSNAALKGAVLEFMESMKALKPIETSTMKYYIGGGIGSSDNWASTAIVAFQDDFTNIPAKTLDMLGTRDSNGDLPFPLVVLDKEGLGSLAGYFLNPGKNTETFLGIDWLNPDTKGLVKVFTSANIAYDKLSKGETDNVPLQLFAKLNQAGPEKLYKASLYGCQKSPQSESTAYYAKYRTFSNSADYLVNTSKLFSLSSGNSVIDASKGDVYLVQVANGKLYAGQEALTCHLNQAKTAGSCSAEVLGMPNNDDKIWHYCKLEIAGKMNGSWADYGVYWDGFVPSAGGKIEFYSGLSPCSTRGMAIEGNEYFTYRFLPDDAFEIPRCSNVLTDGKRDCPYNAGAGYYKNGFDDSLMPFSDPAYCGCVDINEGDYNSLIQNAATAMAGGGNFPGVGQLPAGGDAACQGKYGANAVSGPTVDANPTGEGYGGYMGSAPFSGGEAECWCKKGYKMDVNQCVLEGSPAGAWQGSAVDKECLQKSDVTKSHVCPEGTRIDDCKKQAEATLKTTVCCIGASDWSYNVDTQELSAQGNGVTCFSPAVAGDGAGGQVTDNDRFCQTDFKTNDMVSCSDHPLAITKVGLSRNTRTGTVIECCCAEDFDDFDRNGDVYTCKKSAAGPRPTERSGAGAAAQNNAARAAEGTQAAGLTPAAPTQAQLDTATKAAATATQTAQDANTAAQTATQAAAAVAAAPEGPQKEAAKAAAVTAADAAVDASETAVAASAAAIAAADAVPGTPQATSAIGAASTATSSGGSAISAAQTAYRAASLPTPPAAVQAEQQVADAQAAAAPSGPSAYTVTLKNNQRTNAPIKGATIYLSFDGGATKRPFGPTNDAGQVSIDASLMQYSPSRQVAYLKAVKGTGTEQSRAAPIYVDLEQLRDSGATDIPYGTALIE